MAYPHENISFIHSRPHFFARFGATYFQSQRYFGEQTKNTAGAIAKFKPTKIVVEARSDEAWLAKNPTNKIIDTLNHKRMVTHGGGIFGFNSNLLRIEDDDVCLVLLNNVGNPKRSEITQNLLAVLYDKPHKLPSIKKEIVVSEAVLKKYEGTYEVVPQFQIVITVEKGRLVAQATGQPKFELFAQKDNYFFLKAVEAEVEFVNDEKGAISQLFLYQGGRKTPTKKSSNL